MEMKLLHGGLNPNTKDPGVSPLGKYKSVDQSAKQPASPSKAGKLKASNMPKVKTVGLSEYTMQGFKRLNKALQLGLE